MLGLKRLCKSFCAVLAITVLTIAGSAYAVASPCSGISRQLPSTEEPATAREIAKQLNFPSVDVLQSFRSGSWRILYIDTHATDDVFLFYSRDPATQHFITLWSGAAMPSEGNSIKTWVIKNAPGIPDGLASCFAWHVTRDRDE